MGSRSSARHGLLAGILLLVSAVTTSCADTLEYAPVDGFRNNLGQPTAGIAGSNFVRASPAAYSDGAYEIADKDRPNPMTISLDAHTGPSGEASMFSRNAFQAFYAQLVLDEVAVITPGCPPEYENMPLPSEHLLRKSTDRPQVYQRSTYDQSTGYLSGGPRQQTNLASSFLDGGVIYGTSQVWTSLLRSHSDGKLLADSPNITSSFPAYNNVKLPMLNAPIPLDHQMKNVDRLFRLGNAKGHENPFLLALQVIWFRWHNKVAEDIKASKGNLTDEEIFQAARRMVIAHFQKIVVNDWLPAFLLGNQTNSTVGDLLPSYTKYDSRQQPGITHEFLSAMDFRHTFTPAAVWNLKSCSTTYVNATRNKFGELLPLCWGDRIEWLTLNEGFQKARREHKPLMVVIHQMSCGACMHQKAWFSRSKTIESLSKDLVMVNIENHEVPQLPEYGPDGFYVPRILFFSPHGSFLPDVKIRFDADYKYNYRTEYDLINNMNYVISQYRKG